MTTSTEDLLASDRPDEPFGPRRREAAERAQDAALPAGDAFVSCSAPLGTGGLGRHLSEIVDAFTRRGQPPACVSGATRAGSTSTPRSLRERLDPRALGVAALSLPAPLSPGVRARAFMAEFDAHAARRLAPAQQLVAFNGQALLQLRAAARAGYADRGLVSANSHIRNVARQHELARRRYPLEGSWASHLVARNLAEYAQADRIYYASEYVRESFLREGVDERRLSYFPLTPAPRFSRASRDGDGSEPGGSSRFEIVYVGSLAVHKGVPLLIDAVRRLPGEDIALTLVGGWGTRGMRRFVQAACAADARIAVRPGDPLPHLLRARLCVHPAYEDGFAYAPAEALACGVPVIVSEDTGMKDLLDGPGDGLVLRTGDLDGLTEAIEAAYRGELLAR